MLMQLASRFSSGNFQLKKFFLSGLFLKKILRQSLTLKTFDVLENIKLKILKKIVGNVISRFGEAIFTVKGVK